MDILNYSKISLPRLKMLTDIKGTNFGNKVEYRENKTKKYCDICYH